MPDRLEFLLELSKVQGGWHKPRKRCDWMCQTSFGQFEVVGPYLHVVTTARSFSGARHLRVLQCRIESILVSSNDHRKLRRNREDAVAKRRKDLHMTTPSQGRSAAPALEESSPRNSSKKEMNIGITHAIDITIRDQEFLDLYSTFAAR